MKGERKGIRKFNISYGAGGGIRTHKSLAQRILSPQRMPFHHTRIYNRYCNEGFYFFIYLTYILYHIFLEKSNKIFYIGKVFRAILSIYLPSS